MNPTASSRSYSIAGKVFLLGEYAVVAGKPALVAALAPRFKLSTGLTSGPFPFAAGSPAGRLFSRVIADADEGDRERLRSMGIQFADPHRGLGGFGGSTAEYALLYRAIAAELAWPESRQRWDAVWKTYRELTAGEPLPPSGADLVAQWQGGVVLFDPSESEAIDVSAGFDWSSLLVFSASSLPGRKVATHEHLSALKSLGDLLVENLEEVLLEGIRAVRGGDVALLGQSMGRYADVLWNSGLENAGAHADREALSGLPGVVGVKGGGAMLSDSVLVLLESGSPQREKVITAAQSRGLVLVGDGLASEPGVEVQKS